MGLDVKGLLYQEGEVRFLVETIRLEKLEVVQVLKWRKRRSLMFLAVEEMEIIVSQAYLDLAALLEAKGLMERTKTKRTFQGGLLR